jgi:hypothetical protein
VFAGCSSSSTKANPTDGGGGADVVIHHDSGGSSSSGSDSSPGDDASGDDGGTCSNDVTYTYPGYVKIVPSQACSAAQVQAFEAACVNSTATDTTCNTWQTDNIPDGDAGAGTPCGSCIFAPYNPPTAIPQGAAYVTCDASIVTSPMTATCLFSPNVLGCVQIIDPTNGPACAAADDALTQCEGWECNVCSDVASGGPLDTACVTAADASNCSTFLTAAQTACAADFGDGGAGTPFTECQPGGGSSAAEEFTFIIDQMCGGGGGTGNDGGGVSDAAGGG